MKAANMRIIRNPATCTDDAKGAVIALGNFDGLHKGHRSIISHAQKIAHDIGAPSAIMTFEPHPREFFAKDGKRLRMYSLHQKLALLADLGIDIIYLMQFNQTLANTTAHDFIEGILHQQLDARHLITGHNFAFGKGRSGDTTMLSNYAQEAGFGFTACHAIEEEGNTISSSAIRTLLSEGKISIVNQLLASDYRVCGRVTAGAARGRTIGFPTANISLKHLYKPRYGVYAVKVRLKDDNNWYHAVANVGVKPTFDAKDPLLEVHIFDFDRTIYGQRIEVTFHQFIRPEQRFESIDALIKQINQDIEKTKHILLAT